VFVLGVMVGRRVEARGHVERAQTQAAVDPLAALDRLEGGAGLSFQGALRGVDAPASDVEKTIGELAAKKKDANAKPAKDGKPEAKPEPKLEAKPEPKAPPAPVDAKLDAKPDAKSDHAKADAKPEPKADHAKADAKPEPKADHVQVAKLDAPKLDADKKSEKKDSEKKDGDKKPEPKAESKPKFTLQLSSFQDKGEAEAYLSQVKSNGFGAYLTEADVDGKTYYRIRMGNYRSLDAANDAKADLEKATKKSATVMKL
jgi:septal ring-binding cell division protein DamX